MLEIFPVLLPSFVDTTVSTKATSNDKHTNQEQLPKTRVVPEVLSDTESDAEEVFSKSELPKLLLRVLSSFAQQ